MNSEQRKLEIHKKGPGCELAYFKLGEDKVIASSVAGTKHCEDVEGKVRQHLTAAGYSCQ